MLATSNAAIILCTGVNGLGAVRSLARQGVHVTAVYFEPQSPVHYSSAPARKHLITERGDAPLLKVLASYAADRPVVLACSDEHVEFLSRHFAELTQLGLQLSGPAGVTSDILNDKVRELELLQEMSVVLPKSLTRLPADARAILDGLSLPIIIKPRSFRFAHLINTKNVLARTATDMERFVQAHADAMDKFVAQEVVPGPDESTWVCNCCFGRDANMLTAFTFQRIRTSPAHFGVTSFAVARNNPDIKAQCETLGRALAYVGPAMFEFKLDARRNEYCYLETNPRIGMCNALDTRCGVNNVYTAYLVARDMAPPADIQRQTDGIYFLNAYADSYARFWDREPFWQVMRSYWATRGAAHVWAFYDRRDPKPFIAAVFDAMRKTAVGAMRRAGAAWHRYRGVHQQAE